jgi:hypothetical protein
LVALSPEMNRDVVLRVCAKMPIACCHAWPTG